MLSFAASEHHDLLDVEESRYDQALAAIDCGDRDTAVPLLRRCAEAGTGESAWLLAQLLEDAGDIQEAMTWYRRARAEGDPRAGEKWFGRGTRRRPLTWPSTGLIDLITARSLGGGQGSRFLMVPDAD